MKATIEKRDIIKILTCVKARMLHFEHFKKSKKKKNQSIYTTCRNIGTWICLVVFEHSRQRIERLRLRVFCINSTHASDSHRVNPA